MNPLIAALQALLRAGATATSGATTRSTVRGRLGNMARNQIQNRVESATASNRSSKPPKPPKGLSLKKMMQHALRSWPDRQDNAKRDRVTLVKMKFSGKKKDVLNFSTLTYDKTRSNKAIIRKHEQKIENLVPEKPLSESPALKVTCTCEDWKYTFETVMADKNAADLIYSNGEPPDMRNPLRRLGLCVAKGTAISTPVGKINIENVEVGSYVLTLQGTQRVLAVAETGYDFCDRIVTANENSLLLTSDHKVYARLPDQEFDWIETANLQPGMIVQNVVFDGLQSHIQDDTINYITRKEGKYSVWDLTVETDENFVASNIVVHNCKHLIVAVGKTLKQNL